MGTFALDSLILCLQGKSLLILLVCFLPMTLKKRWYNLELFQRWINAILLKLTKQTCQKRTKFRLSENNRNWKLFSSRDQSKKIMHPNIKQVCYSLWLHRQDFNCFKHNNWCSTSVVRAPVGIESPSFNLIFLLTTEIIKKLLSIARNKKKNHNKILILAKSKLDSIKTLVSQALIDMEISHDEFVTILKGKKTWKNEFICQECEECKWKTREYEIK